MKKVLFKLSITILIAFFFSSCFDPIFYTISQEVPKLDPYINGAATNFTKTSGGDIYAASGKTLYKYNGLTGSWNRSSVPTPPGGLIRQLAITNKYLYALCETESGIKLKYADYNQPSLNWNEFTINNLQTIFAVSNILYISVRNIEEIEKLPDNNKRVLYSISYIIDDGAVTPIAGLDKVSQLVGAAFNGNADYYLCTKDGYYFSSGSSTGFAAGNFCVITSTIDSPDEFVGIISLGKGDKVAAISRMGKLFDVTPNADLGPIIAGFIDTRSATGALAVYTIDGYNLLLAGRQDMGYSTSSGYTYGYVEIEFDDLGNISDPTRRFWVPGETGKPSTVDDQTRFINSIGKNPVNYIIQVKPDDKLLFAVTQKNGIWSYRERNQDNKLQWQWNAEE